MTVLNEQAVAKVYVVKQDAKSIAVNPPGTQYQLKLGIDQFVQPTAQGRVRGVIHIKVWKVDEVTAGGAFIEPLVGRPRRVQGCIVEALPESNSLLVEVSGIHIVADLPSRWNAASFAIGTRVGLDVLEGAMFEPVN